MHKMRWNETKRTADATSVDRLPVVSTRRGYTALLELVIGLSLFDTTGIHTFIRLTDTISIKLYRYSYTYTTNVRSATLLLPTVRYPTLLPPILSELFVALPLQHHQQRSEPLRQSNIDYNTELLEHTVTTVHSVGHSKAMKKRQKEESTR